MSRMAPQRPRRFSNVFQGEKHGLPRPGPRWQCRGGLRTHGTGTVALSPGKIQVAKSEIPYVLVPVNKKVAVL